MYECLHTLVMFICTYPLIFIVPIQSSHLYVYQLHLCHVDQIIHLFICTIGPVQHTLYFEKQQGKCASSGNSAGGENSAVIESSTGGDSGGCVVNPEMMLL